MTDLKRDTSVTGKENQQMKEMPFGMKIVVSIVFILLALWFSALIIDVVSSEMILSNSRTEMVADITNKITTHGKNGYRYFIEYVFTVNDKEYNRNVLFQLFDKKTEVNRFDYDTYEIGNKLPIYYVKTNPGYNKPKNSTNTYKNFLWYILGIAVFGVIGINELKNLYKKKEL